MTMLTTTQQKKESASDRTGGSSALPSLMQPHESPPQRRRRTATVTDLVAAVVAILLIFSLVVVITFTAELRKSGGGGRYHDWLREKINNNYNGVAPRSFSVTGRRGLKSVLDLRRYDDPKKTETVRREQVEQQQRVEELRAKPFSPPRVETARPHPQNQIEFARDAHLNTIEVNRAASMLHTSPGHRPTVRYLTFGTSMTWGAGLRRRMDAYPYLLSPRAKNVAIRASTGVYSALCAESLTGDDATFDVVVIEFHQVGNDGLLHLARRIRRRFPDATVVFLRLWYPLQIRDVGTNQNVKEWAGERGHTDVHSPGFHTALLDSRNQWRWADYQSAMELQDRAAAEVDGHIISIPRPDEPRDFVKFAQYISDDWHHLSERGHEYVARNVLQILLNNGGVVREPRLGTWSGGDSCHSWFESGEFPYEHSSNVRMEQMDDAGTKHALSILQQSGEITVFNPSDVQLELYLTYMTTGPAPSKYPRTEVTIVGSKQQKPVTIDPTAPDYGHRVHVALTRRVGSVKPGKSVVQLKPLEETEYPFRITAMVVTGTSGVEGAEEGLAGMHGKSTVDAE